MPQSKTPLYQTQQIRELETLVQERFSLSGYSLMQRAGKAAFDFLQKRWPQVQKVAVFCGRGNNGGDGYLTALIAKERGLQVRIWQVGDHSELSEETKQAKEACEQANISIQPYHAQVEIGRPDLVIDAICGIGIQDQLREDVIALVERIQALNVPIFAIDMPTGIDADTGRLLGAAVKATATITFIGLKLGLFTGQGTSYAGEIVLNDLQLPSELFSYVHPVADKVQLAYFASYLKPRHKNWHKGLSGHVLIIGGSPGYTGAPRMAALAALRVGAGLVSVATQPDHAALMNVNCPEVMCHGIEKMEHLKPLLSRADVVVIGPGLGQSDWAKQLWNAVNQLEMPIVVDADALNLLAQEKYTNTNWILTPHPGEAARLLDVTVDEVQEDRLEAAKAIQHAYDGVCILKGAGSIVYAPNKLPTVCDKGNPGMATGGMGDVLSGVIGGWLAQGVPLAEAASLSVCQHAMAGDLAAKEGERGMIATDLLPYLKRLSNHAD